MTDELVEQVARALAAVEYGDGHDEPWWGFCAHARAVIPLIYSAAIEDMKAVEAGSKALSDFR